MQTPHKSSRISQSLIALLLGCAMSLAVTAGTLTTITDPNVLPTIGEPADRYLSPAQEKALGAHFFRSQFNAGVVLEDPEITQYIQYLGNTLTPQLGNNEHEFTFFVVNQPTINAFAVPGGYIGVNAGLILATNNENELAGVLAHEIAHVSQRHLARRLAEQSKQSIPTLAILLGAILAAGSGSPDATSAILFGGLALNAQNSLSFSRSNEIEADRIGLGILYKSNYDPNGMAGFFEVLQRKRFTPASRQFEYLSTHPLDNTRISEARSRIDNLAPIQRPDSLLYTMAKARLQALMTDNPRALLSQLEKEQSKKKTSLMDKYAYSQALLQNNEYKEAAKILEELVQNDKENVNFQLSLAKAYLQIGEAKKSEDTLKKMIAIYPDNYSVTMTYASLLKTNERATDCRDLLKGYLQAHDSVPTTEIFKLLSDCYHASNDPVDSKQTLAYYYFTNGNYRAAVVQLQEILRRQDLDFITRSQIESQLKAIMGAIRNSG